MRPVMQRYIQSLLLTALREDTVEKVVTQLRKLPWSEGHVEDWFVRAMTECAEVKYYAIPLVAGVAAGLAKHAEGAIIRFVDVAVERLRSAIDRNDVGDAQVFNWLHSVDSTE